jgi:hypothetical protein
LSLQRRVGVSTRTGKQLSTIPSETVPPMSPLVDLQLDNHNAHRSRRPIILPKNIHHSVAVFNGMASSSSVAQRKDPVRRRSHSVDTAGDDDGDGSVGSHQSTTSMIPNTNSSRSRGGSGSGGGSYQEAASSPTSLPQRQQQRRRNSTIYQKSNSERHLVSSSSVTSSSHRRQSVVGIVTKNTSMTELNRNRTTTKTMKSLSSNTSANASSHTNEQDSPQLPSAVTGFFLQSATTASNTFQQQIHSLRQETLAEYELLQQNNNQDSHNHHEQHSQNDDDEEVRIRVIVRKRPMTRTETGTGGDVDIVQPLDYGSYGRILVYQPKTRVDLTKQIETVPFAFDTAFDGTCSNTNIYERSIRNLIPSFFAGQWASIFAYGQTGSGVRTITTTATATATGRKFVECTCFQNVSTRLTSNLFYIRGIAFLDIYVCSINIYI